MFQYISHRLIADVGSDGGRFVFLISSEPHGVTDIDNLKRDLIRNFNEIALLILRFIKLVLYFQLIEQFFCRNVCRSIAILIGQFINAFLTV